MIIFMLVFAVSAVNAQDLNESASDLNMDEGMPISNVGQDEESSQEVLGDGDVPISDSLPTVESGVVSGGVDIAAVHPWAPSNSSGNLGNVSYVIPDDATDIKFAHVYVSIYSGSAQPTYGSVADINVTVNGELILNSSETLWYPTGSADGVNYIVNDHITKCYSDYMIFYNITDAVRGMSGATVSVDVLSKPLQNRMFDGRIKLVSVVMAYDDGDSDVINYWFKEGQAWTNRDLYSYFETEDVEITEESNSTLTHIALSSIDGQYILNSDHLFDSEEDIQGAYYQYHRWLVDDYMVSGEETELKYIASTDGWGSFKAVMALLTIQTPHEEPVIPKVNTSISIVADIANRQITATLSDVNGGAVGGADMYYIINDGEPVSVLSNGSGSFVVGNLAGHVDIFVSYAGNDSFEASNNTDSFDFGSPRVETSIGIAGDIAKKQITVTLTDINGSAVGGAGMYYTINDGESVYALSDGKGSFVVENLIGDVSISVTYAGNETFAPSNNTASISFPKRSTKMMVTSIDGAKLELTAVLLDDANRPIIGALVSYTLNGASKANATTDGNGEFTVAIANNALLAMNYGGNNVYYGSDVAITIKNIVPTPKDTIIEVPSTMTKTAVDYNAGEKGTMFYFYLKDADGKALANKAIKIGIFDKIYTVKTDSNGRGGLQINIANANYYTYAISFLGDDDYKASFAVCSLEIVKKPITITPAKTSYTFKASAKTKTVTATLKSSNSYIPKGKQVTLAIAGKTFKATIGDKGQISFNIGSLTAKGTYKVTIKYAGSNTYSAATSKTITIKIS